MNKTWKAIGIAAITAGLLYYPALRLYRYLAAKKENEGEEEEHRVKAFLPAYRGKHKPHHRHTHNGHAGPDMA